MKISTCFLFLSIALVSFQALAQEGGILSNISFTGYVDAYGAVYTDSIDNDAYQKFPSVSPRSHQVGLNVASLSAKYESDRLRSTITLHYGDIPRSTWSGTFNFIQEANAGIRICKTLWIDGGFFRSHVGTEGLFPKENITSSVAVPTYFEPLYEAGFKLNYLPTDKLTLNLFLLNGYNLYEDNNRKKSVGLLATYAFSDKLVLGYDNYIGDDAPQGDTVSRTTFYNNVWVNFEKGIVKIIGGIDFGIRANAAIDEADKSASMFSGLVSIRIQPEKEFNFYGRVEVFTDPDGFLSGVFVDENNESTGLKLWGGTLGVEYKPLDNAYVRVEGRFLQTPDSQPIFYWDGENKNSRLEGMINMGVWFP